MRNVHKDVRARTCVGGFIFGENLMSNKRYLVKYTLVYTRGKILSSYKIDAQPSGLLWKDVPDILLGRK